LALAAAALAAPALLLASCGGSEDLKRLMSLEDRGAVGAPPQSVEELKAGIERYAKEAERVVEATEKVGIYYKILASRLLEKQLYGEAYEALAKAIEYYPGSPTLYYKAGYSAGLVAKGKAALGPDGAEERRKWLATAESCYRAALSSSPRFAEAMYGLAVLYEFELDRPQDALPLLRSLLEIETRNADAMLLLGRVYYRLGRLEDAANVYETAAKVTRVAEKKAAAEANRKRVLEELGGE
jgi:tetratricopeptide (TPR) repeat protein